MATAHTAVSLIAWDFDGTLATRRGGWAGACVDAIERADPDTTVSIEDVRPHLATGFPWHEPMDPHPGVTTPEAWWDRLQPVLERAVAAQEYEAAEATAIARSVREVYLTEGWSCYPDTIETLERLGDAGWTHVICSNHVPTLSRIVADLGLDEHVDAVFTSGRTGYEKPHPRAFDPVLEVGSEPRWMVGDSATADIEGAAAVGIPGILVRSSDPSVDRQCDGLAGVVDYLE